MGLQRHQLHRLAQGRPRDDRLHCKGRLWRLHLRLGSVVVIRPPCFAATAPLAVQSSPSTLVQPSFLFISSSVGFLRASFAAAQSTLAHPFTSLVARPSSDNMHAAAIMILASPYLQCRRLMWRCCDWPRRHSDGFDDGHGFVLVCYAIVTFRFKLATLHTVV